MHKYEHKTKYFLYARKSSESEDRQVASIESQISELTKTAKENNFEIVEILSESQSAKAPGRPIFAKMIERIYKGEAQGIICWKLDRLARNPVDGGNISWMLQRGIIQHIQTHERDYYPTDNVLMMSVEFSMANQFILDLSQNTKRGLRTKAEKGWYPGPAPTGYLNSLSKRRGEKKIIKDPKRF
jgi:DNA invertase Pin-like site-specific DNA recombinase